MLAIALTALLQPIVDPLNQPALAPRESPAGEAARHEPAAGLIADPLNTPARPTPPGPVAAPGSAAPGTAAIFSGAFGSSNAIDFARDDRFEDTLDLRQRLEARARLRLTARWTAVIEGRLRWQMTGASSAGAPTFEIEAESAQGSIEPELRDLYVSGRAGSWLLRLGQQSIVWGSTDMSKPADVINPMDYRGGVVLRPGDARIPIPAFDATWTTGSIALELVVVPFFVPHQAHVFGADVALFRAPLAVPGVGTIPIALSDLLPVDPSLEPLLQPLLFQTRRPEAVPRNASAGARATFSPAGADVSLGYFFGWDRFPLFRLRDDVAALAASLGDVMAELPPGAVDPDLVRDAVLGLVGDEPLWTATYERRHVVEADGVTYLGPVGVRFEVAFSPQRTLYLADLTGVRRPSALAAVGLSYESTTGEVVVGAEVFGQHTATREGDGAYLLDTHRMRGLALGGTFDFAAIPGLAARRASDLSLELGVVVLPDHGDVIATPRVAFDATPTWELAIGASVFAAAEPGGIGTELDRNDALTVELTKVF